MATRGELMSGAANKQLLRKVLPYFDVAEPDGKDMVMLFDELMMETAQSDSLKGFYFNRGAILQGWKDGRVHTFRYSYKEAGDPMRDQLYAAGLLKSSMSGALITLPAFIYYEPDGPNTKIEFLWVREDCRRAGLASKLLEGLHSPHVPKALPEAETFWRKVGIPFTLISEPSTSPAPAKKKKLSIAK